MCDRNWINPCVAPLQKANEYNARYLANVAEDMWWESQDYKSCPKCQIRWLVGDKEYERIFRKGSCGCE